MKKISLLLFLMGFLPQIIHAQTAKAIWCAGNKTLYLVYDNITYRKNSSYVVVKTINSDSNEDYALYSADYAQENGLTGESITATAVYTKRYCPNQNNGNGDDSVDFYDNIASADETSTVDNWVKMPWYRHKEDIETICFTSGWQPSKTYAYWFGYLKNLTTVLGAHKMVSDRTTDLSHIFHHCSNLTDIDVKDWDTSKVTDMYDPFMGSKFTTLSVENWNTSSLERASLFFRVLTELTSLTFGANLNFTALSSYRHMFYADEKLRYIDFYLSNYPNATALSSVERNTENTVFYRTPLTTLIYLPHGSENVTGVTNVVYSYNGDETDLRCPYYYSEDTKDIEIPREFNTKEAVYRRAMNGATIGTAMLPYDYASNDSIQAYVLYGENETQMCFKSVEVVEHNTPFVFKVKKARDDGEAHFHMGDKNSTTFDITVYPTIDKTLDEDGNPKRIDTDYFEYSYAYNGWKARGYYVGQTIDDTDAFYINRAGTKFYPNPGTITLSPHRVSFHGQRMYGNGGAKTFGIEFVDLPTAIAETDMRETLSKAEAIYDMQGRKISALQKGINIVRTTDGSVKKVIIK